MTTNTPVIRARYRSAADSIEKAMADATKALAAYAMARCKAMSKRGAKREAHIQSGMGTYSLTMGDPILGREAELSFWDEAREAYGWNIIPTGEVIYRNGQLVRATGDFEDINL